MGDNMDTNIDFLKPLNITLEELLTYNYLQFLATIKFLSLNEKIKLLNNKAFINKLFLLDGNENIWLFENVNNVYSFKELLPFMKDEILQKMIQRKDQKSYVYLVTFIRNDKEEFMQNIFTNPEFLNFFIKEGGKIYSELIFNYDFTLKLVNYSIQKNIYLDDLFLNIIYYSITTKEEQKDFLNSINDNDFLVRLLFIFDPNIVSEYLKNNVVGLTTGEIFRLMLKTNVPLSMYENKVFFNKHINDISLLKMDETIDNLSQHNNVTYFHNIKQEMLLKILSLYNFQKQIIEYEPVESTLEDIEPYQAYLNRFYFSKYNLNDQEKAHQLLINIGLNLLYGDSLKNLYLDINEMLSFNSSLNPSYLTKEKIQFYHDLINIANWDNNKIYAFFQQYQNHNLKEEYYDDMRNIKNIAYQQLKDKCLDINNITNLKNEEQTQNYGIPIYELNGENFNALVSCQPDQTGDYAHRIRKCYSLISQNNLDVFNESLIIYGYTHFPYENIIHIL